MDEIRLGATLYNRPSHVVALTPGTRLGVYEILSLLGAGGMGEVYKARDIRLDRTVAIKVMPPDLAADPQFRTRFDREARTISQLSHPHICTLHDVGEADGTAFLVMELLQGESLGDRLKRGAVPLDQALQISMDVADALTAAHRHGIVHRDLKPGNMFLTKSGAKLLDFGLAKAAAAAVRIANPLQTASTHLTGSGTILGTLDYMSPEQVEGKEADTRSDIWSFGAVVYEMVTGIRPFTGDTAASVVSSILKDTPPPITSRQPIVPAALDRLVSTCLAKDPDDRWQSAADISHQIRSIRERDVVEQNDSKRPRAGRALIWLSLALIGIAMLALAAVRWTTWRTTPSAAAEAMQLAMLTPAGTVFSSPPSSVGAPQIALSPDGKLVAVVAESPGGRPNLWVRSLRAPDAQRLQGTDDARYPFWSPDSRSIAFFSQGKLKVIDAGGGPIRTLSDAPLDARGGTWGPDGTIVFAPAESKGLYRVPASGGRVEQVTQFDTSREESSHRFPSFLPDGRHFLFTTRAPRQEDWGTSVGSLDSAASTPIIPRSESGAKFAPPDFVLFLRAGTLLAQHFDLKTFKTIGDPIQIATDVGSTTTGYAAFSVSDTGTIIHARHIGVPGQLRWFDRQGRSVGAVGDVGEYLDFSLSPDGRSLGATRMDDPGAASADVWLIDLARNVPTRLTTNPTNDASVLWAPDNGTVAFRSNREGYTKLYEKRPGGTGPEKMVLDSGTSLIPTDWSRDGSTFLFASTTTVSAGFRLWRWSPADNAAPTLVVDTPQNAMHGRLSPGGAWVAYASDDSGRLEVYVQPFPGPGDRQQISPDGGAEPHWRADGRELFYLAANGALMSVDIPTGNPLAPGATRPLFDVRVPLAGNPYRSNYDVRADGQRFLVNTRVEEAVPAINVILNWPALLKK